MWLKYKHKWSHGYDEELWKYVGTTNIEFVKDEAHELEREYEWSEHYRGIDYEVVEVPPVTVLKKAISTHESIIEHHSNHLIYLKNLLSKTEIGDCQKA